MSFLRPLIRKMQQKPHERRAAVLLNEEDLKDASSSTTNIIVKWEKNREAEPCRINANEEIEHVTTISVELPSGDLWTPDTPKEDIKRCPKCQNKVMRKSIRRCMRCGGLCCETKKCAPYGICRRCRILRAIFGM